VVRGQVLRVSLMGRRQCLDFNVLNLHLSSHTFAWSCGSMSCPITKQAKLCVRHLTAELQTSVVNQPRTDSDRCSRNGSARRVVVLNRQFRRGAPMVFNYAVGTL
jgi:hypothetical protein